MNSGNDYREARELLVLDLGMEIHSSKITEEALLNFISVNVEELLNSDMSRLMSILYRVDVAEKRVKLAFAECSAGGLAKELARLIFERELQKIESRRRYKTEL